MILSHTEQNTGLRLQQTLAQWRQWRCDPPLPGAPHLLHRLQGGLSNYNYLVQAGAQKLVIRLDGVNPASHGLSRQAEWLALQSAASAGIAPMPRYFNPELGALVTDFHEAELAREPSVQELSRLLRNIHALPPRRHRVDLGDRFQNYLHQVQRGGTPGLPADHRKRLDALLTQSRELDQTAPVLTHNDLLPANLLCCRQSGNWLALDWEYCGMGTPWFDLAVASFGQGLDEQGRHQLLESYLRRPPTPQDSELLRIYGALAAYMSLVWHLVTDPEEAASLLEQRLPQFEGEVPSP